MQSLTYVGPHRPGVDVVLPDGREVFVAYEKSAEFTDEVAKSLLDQGQDYWIKKAPDAPKEK